MRLPETIPSGVRIVVRTKAGIDPHDGRMKYSDYLGHVRSWDGMTLVLDRDPSRDGSRPAETVRLDSDSIVIIKPVPERKPFPSPPSREAA
ncbi:MAG: hypothetical protein LKJ44_03530 [Bifidobacteriaceae bacterium]|nr:hypothetical protein [Bifidobacteriaceae bacterium]MCI1978771.1 hypothetical protein [Bifidobacteriaceae bacterium]